MTLRRAGRLLTVLPVVVAWLDASTAWCFCTRAASTPAPARAVVVAGGASSPPVLAAVVAPELAVNPAPAPTSPRMVPPPAVVLRI